MVKCPAGKIINPDTGRCVDRNGTKGKEILARGKKKSSTKKSKCPAGKIINPESGRCVDRNGTKGKEILGSGKKKSSTKKSKCPSGKIINPDTGRCVDRNGSKGKEILGSPKKKSSTKKPKDCTRQTTAKYNSSTRKSPPYPANKCHNKIMIGNDGNMYASKPNVNGIYTWRVKK